MFIRVFSILVLITVLLGLAGCGSPTATAQPETQATEAEAQPTQAEAQPTQQEQGAGEAVTLQVWAEANAVEHWRADGPADAAKAVTDFNLTVEPLRDEAGWADYKKKFTLAADAGEAPDIVLSGDEDVPVWGNVGYIVDFAACRDKYPEFDDV